MVDKYFKREIIEMSILVIYVIFVIGSLSLFFLFGGGGIEKSSILQTNNFYIPYGIAFLIGLVAIKVIGLFIFREKDEEFEGGFIHDPEQTPFKIFRIVSNPLLLLFFSIVVFSLIFWAFTSQQVFFNATPNYEQQFTVGADLFFSVYPASPSETLGALFLISLYGLILGMFVIKGKLSKVLFFILFVVGSIFISGTFGVVNHLARYGFDEIAIRNVIVFWSFGGFITALTGSVIPFLVMHDLNNAMYRLSKLFSNDIITFIVSITVIILLILFFFVYFKFVKRKNVKRSKEN